MRRLKIEGEGFKQHWEEGFIHGAPCLGGGTTKGERSGNGGGRGGKSGDAGLQQDKTWWRVGGEAHEDPNHMKQRRRRGKNECKFWLQAVSLKLLMRSYYPRGNVGHSGNSLYKMLNNWATKI